MSPRRPPPPHAQAHLPALDGADALLVVNILHRISEAIWRAHGPAMHASLEETYYNVPATVSTGPYLGEHDDALPPDLDWPF